MSIVSLFFFFFLSRVLRFLTFFPSLRSISSSQLQSFMHGIFFVIPFFANFHEPHKHTCTRCARTKTDMMPSKRQHHCKWQWMKCFSEKPVWKFQTLKWHSDWSAPTRLTIETKMNIAQHQTCHSYCNRSPFLSLNYLLVPCTAPNLLVCSPFCIAVFFLFRRHFFLQRFLAWVFGIDFFPSLDRFFSTHHFLGWLLFGWLFQLQSIQRIDFFWSHLISPADFFFGSSIFSSHQFLPAAFFSLLNTFLHQFSLNQWIDFAGWKRKLWLN